MKTGFLLYILLILFFPFSCTAARGSAASRGERDNTPAAEAPREMSYAATEFTDDDNKKIIFQKPFSRIIVLYPAHAENLFFIGAGTQVIGVSGGTDFPPEAAALPEFDYHGDPEYIIAAAPDLVLIRPFVRRNSPDYITEIEKAGIPVVSLYPERFENFDTYIRRLGMLSGKSAEAEEKLAAFHRGLGEIKKRGESIREKKSVFFESTENEIRTAASDSLPAMAIEFAGGVNAAPGLPPISPGSSIARFGAETLLGIADKIDVYVVQQGAMNPVSGIGALRARPGFGAVRAVREGRVLFISEKLISSATFRYLDGVKILADYLNSLDEP